jgi:hypothetical protein
VRAGKLDEQAFKTKEKNLFLPLNLLIYCTFSASMLKKNQIFLHFCPQKVCGGGDNTVITLNIFSKGAEARAPLFLAHTPVYLH